MKVLDRKQLLAKLSGWLVDAQEHLATHHGARKRLLRRSRARNRLDLLAPPQDGDAVSDLEHFVQLVADEDDRLAVRLEAANDREELRRLLWRQDSGRLVENENLCAAIQC